MVNRLQKIANILRRFPWIIRLATHVYRLGRPRFSAGVVGVIFNTNNEVLLVEHVFHPDHPWGLPGGWVDRAEPLDVAVAREVREELQLSVEAKQVLHVEIATKRFNHIDVAYLCTTQGDVGELSAELLQYRWTPTDALPDRIPVFHRHAIQQASQLRSSCLR